MARTGLTPQPPARAGYPGHRRGPGLGEQSLAVVTRHPQARARRRSASSLAGRCKNDRVSFEGAGIEDPFVEEVVAFKNLG